MYVLDNVKRNHKKYSPLLNHLVRRVGLFPYIEEDSADWQDRLAVEAFKVDVGEEKDKALHREQSGLLARLLRKESVAVSAPTSFGKSFVIDAFISIAKPSRVLIIVPTIALMDETRRRLYRKFSKQYKIITTTDVDDFGERSIFIFPQERAITYANRIKSLDLLVVDEFYKASSSFDKSRSPALIRAIIRFSAIAKQRYFLAPNISGLKDNPFTKGMEFLRLDFNTVVLRKHDLYKSLNGDKEKKAAELKRLMLNDRVKTLIYAGSHPQVAKVGAILENSQKQAGSFLLTEFASWLEINYAKNWILPRLVRKGIGLHNGQLHRSLSQIQIRLFEDPLEINTIISTSSIIEGVNTSAERVVIWNNKNGSTKLTDFDYRNIVGRSGRMFRHFVGDVFVLEAPPQQQDQQLDLQLPDALLGMEEIESLIPEMSNYQLERISKYEADIDKFFDLRIIKQMQSSGKLQTSDTAIIKKMVVEISSNKKEWQSLANLNSNNVEAWNWILFRVMNLENTGWDAKFGDIVAFVKVISSGWNRTIPQQLQRLSHLGLGIDDFFKLERTVTYKLSTLLGDLNSIHARICPDRGFDISPAVFRMAHAFLPPVVYQLEELGLPRMMSRKIYDAKILIFDDQELTLDTAVSIIVDARALLNKKIFFNPFENYVFGYFIEGVSAVDIPARASNI